MAASSPLRFSVRRRKPVLVAPAAPTPRELKRLSDIDDQEGLRFQIPVIQFYRHVPSMDGRDPAGVVINALARSLVFYYPFAGRLREGEGGKLFVDCTGEGVLFIEADGADVELAEFGDSLQPPFPCLEELLFDIGGSSAVLDAPLLLIQLQSLCLNSSLKNTLTISQRFLLEKIHTLNSTSSSNIARDMDHSVLGGPLHSTDNVPVELRENYYFALLLDNLNRSTNTETLKSIFGSLPGVLYTTVDVDTEGQPMGIGEVVFTDEATMRDATQKMTGQIIESTKIFPREMVLFDVKRDHVKDHL